ncbi:hypothetical protein [Hymenobacter sp. B81]|uniref:hypothetical protein n=1 Tax=Hymenobacter sp. B81 TaxID=3344878 RepID=UPI0037DD7A0C
MRRYLPWLALPFLALACRPDQVEHLENGAAIDREAENWKPKRILPAQLLAAAHWAGDSLTRSAEQAWRAQLSERLAAGGVAEAHPYCQPEKLPFTVHLSRELEARPSRRLVPPRPITEADSVTVLRPTADEYVFQKPLVMLPDQECRSCHGQVPTDVSAADAALLARSYPGKKLSGYGPGQLIGWWKVPMSRRGVAEFYTMKTRKVFRRR